MILIDTAALLAVINAEDSRHQAAKEVWVSLIQHDTSMICNSYVLLETLALLQARIGLDAVQDFQENVKPLLSIEWVTETEHNAAMQLLLATNRRRISLIDCASFATMRRLGIKTAFTFDKHFTEQGFEVMP